MRKIWSGRSWDEYTEWQTEDRKILRRINALIKDIERNGCMTGIGKPEALKYKLAGWYSRHIDDKHRLVYRMPDDNTLEIHSAGIIMMIDSKTGRIFPVLLFCVTAILCARR